MIRLQYEYFGNPLYNDLGQDVHEGVPHLSELVSQVEKLVEKLNEAVSQESGDKHRAKFF